MTKREVQGLFSYHSNGTLTWKKPPKQYHWGKDRPIGSKHKKGYIHASVNGKMWKVHRLIFLFHKGFLPEQIDHKNQIKDDNRIGNLRAATQTQNQGNLKLNSRNTSGYRGVTWRKQQKKWCAQISVKGEKVYLGLFNCKHTAARVFNRAAKKHFKEFANLNGVLE